MKKHSSSLLAAIWFLVFTNPPVNPPLVAQRTSLLSLLGALPPEMVAGNADGEQGVIFSRRSGLNKLVMPMFCKKEEKMQEADRKMPGKQSSPTFVCGWEERNRIIPVCVMTPSSNLPIVALFIQQCLEANCFFLYCV